MYLHTYVLNVFILQAHFYNLLLVFKDLSWKRSPGGRHGPASCSVSLAGDFLAIACGWTLRLPSSVHCSGYQHVFVTLPPSVGGVPCPHPVLIPLVLSGPSFCARQAEALGRGFLSSAGGPCAVAGPLALEGKPLQLWYFQTSSFRRTVLTS